MCVVVVAVVVVVVVTLCMYLLTLCVNKKQTVLWLQLLEGVLTVGFASC